MTWRYRNIQTFPARYPSALREAVANLGDPILFNSYPTEADAADDCQTFRWYRWCLRERPDHDFVLGSYSDLYTFRISTEPQPSGSCLVYLTAKPTKLSELLELNPDLADIFAATSQPENSSPADQMPY